MCSSNSDKIGKLSPQKAVDILDTFLTEHPQYIELEIANADLMAEKARLEEELVNKESRIDILVSDLQVYERENEELQCQILVLKRKLGEP